MDKDNIHQESLIIAVSKGRILKETLPLLECAGVVPTESPDTSRKLVLPTTMPGVKLLVIRATDVPTFVQHGAADMGIAGKDVLIEFAGDGLYEPIDLGIARCRMSLAAPEGYLLRGNRVRVATKYVRIAASWFASRGIQADFVKLYGSMELAPLVGLADCIVDLVDTGNTLRANGLVELEEIMTISSRLIVNKASMKMKHDRVSSFIEQMGRGSDPGQKGN